MNTKTRPCKPGDQLCKQASSCGAYYTISVGEPTPHPSSGTTDARDVRLVLRVYLPTECGGLHPAMHSRSECILDEPLQAYWGGLYNCNGTRIRERTYDSLTIVGAYAEAVIDGEDALLTVQTIYDAHTASVVALESYRQEQYASWQVQDQEEGE